VVTFARFEIGHKKDRNRVDTVFLGIYYSVYQSNQTAVLGRFVGSVGLRSSGDAGTGFLATVEEGFSVVCFGVTSFFLEGSFFPVTASIFLGVAAINVVLAKVSFSMVTTLEVVVFSSLKALDLSLVDCTEMLGRIFPFPFLMFSDFP